MRFINTTRRGRALGVLLLSMAAGAVVPVAQASAAHEIKPRHTLSSNQCIDVPFSDLSPGRGLIEWGCNGQNNQRFTLTSTNDGYWKIVANHSNLCLSVRGASTANGANIEQSTCIIDPATRLPADHQRFRLLGFGGVNYALVAKNSGKCWDIAGANQSQGTKLQQWDCHYGDNQRFLFVWH